MTKQSDVEAAAFSIGGVPLERRAFIKGLAAIAIMTPLAACTSGGSTSQSSVPPTGTAAPGPEAAIPGPPWQGGVRGGNGISLWSDETLNFDPPLAYGQGDYYGLSNFYRGLAYYNGKNEPELDMAKSLDVSTDRKSVV